MSRQQLPRIRDLGEERLVARFRDMAAAAPADSVVVGSGDDAAVMRAGNERLLLLTCDMMVEEIHFRRQWAQPRQIGAKAIVQNLSDVAAMGGEPAFAVCSVAAPPDLPAQVLDEIVEGLISTASRHGAAVVGGDLVGSPGPIVIDVALTGWVEEELLLLRGGAKPGDAILVTGSLGASAAGLAALRRGLTADALPDLTRALGAHHEPQPRLVEARAIAHARRASAMMDLSDGLADDLPRLCSRSKVGAQVHADRIPVDPSCSAVAARLGGPGADPLALAISGGEDYELLFTCPPHAVEDISAAVSQAAAIPVTVIGEIVAEEKVLLVDADGTVRSLPAGFDHFGLGGSPELGGAESL